MQKRKQPDEQSDLGTVLAEVNKITEQEIGAKLQIQFISTGSYAERMRMNMASSSDYDLCFTSSWLNNFDTNVKAGAFYDLTEFIDDAEYVSVKHDMLMPIPNNCSMVEAAAIPEAFATAYLNLFIEGKIQEGNTLLMNAGDSGLASVVIPMAKAFGIRVITTVLSDEIAKSIKHLNADVIINTTNQNIADELKKQLNKGHPVDVAIDCLGGDMQGKCLPYMQHGGRWIMIATLAGNMTQVDLKNIFVRNVRIVGSTLRLRTPKVKAEILASLVRDVWEKVESGMVKPTIYKTLPITEAEEAHAILQRGESVGKVVLTVK